MCLFMSCHSKSIYNQKPTFGMFCWQTFSPFQCEYSCCGCACQNLLTIVPSLLINYLCAPVCCIYYFCDKDNALITGCFPAAGILYMPEGYEIIYHKIHLVGEGCSPDGDGGGTSMSMDDTWEYDGFPPSYGKITECFGKRMVCFARKPDINQCWSCWHEKVLSKCGYIDLGSVMNTAQNSRVEINERTVTTTRVPVR